MDRRRFLLTSLISAVAAPLAAGGFRLASAEPVRIGILHPGTARPTEPSRVTALRMGLRELGYVEGRDFSIVARYAEGEADRLPALSADLVRQRVTAIVASGFAIAPAQKATRNMPTRACTWCRSDRICHGAARQPGTARCRVCGPGIRCCAHRHRRD